jgi:aminomethyltransferase
MPVQFTGVIPEYRAVRTQVGVFDISHTGQLTVSGTEAATWLGGLLNNGLQRLSCGEGQYTLMLNS